MSCKFVYDLFEMKVFSVLFPAILQGLENLCNPSLPSTSYHNTYPSTPWSALRTLFLGYNPLGSGSALALSSLLSLTPGLLQLGLQSCGLEEKVLETHTGLGQALKGMHVVRKHLANAGSWAIVS